MFRIPEYRTRCRLLLLAGFLTGHYHGYGDSSSSEYSSLQILCPTPSSDLDLLPSPYIRPSSAEDDRPSGSVRELLLLSMNDDPPGCSKLEQHDNFASSFSSSQNTSLSSSTQMESSRSSSSQEAALLLNSGVCAHVLLLVDDPTSAERFSAASCSLFCFLHFALLFLNQT